ncbi:hypothetical protein V1523DRAFT_417314 [Lipomyces doorenjongii]
MFTQRCHLNAHRRSIHFGEKHSCDFEGCEKMFTQRSNLNAHRRIIHFGERPYGSDTRCTHLTTHQGPVLQGN